MLIAYYADFLVLLADIRVQLGASGIKVDHARAVDQLATLLRQ